VDRPWATNRDGNIPPEMTEPEMTKPKEVEPDVRFTYANERTFLAWNCTALALIVTGVAATQLLPQFHVPKGREILGVPLIALGALVAITSFRKWRANEQAMGQHRPLPSSRMTAVLSIGIRIRIGIGIVSVISVVLVLRGSK
jgi:putative membrane protein